MRLGELIRRTLPGSLHRKRAIRCEAARIVAAVAGDRAQARWRRGEHGAPAMVVVVLEDETRTKEMVASLHGAWLAARPDGPDLDFVVIASTSGRYANSAVALLVNATVNLEPDPPGRWHRPP